MPAARASGLSQAHSQQATEKPFAHHCQGLHTTLLRPTNQAHQAAHPKGLAPANRPHGATGHTERPSPPRDHAPGACTLACGGSMTGSKSPHRSTWKLPPYAYAKLTESHFTAHSWPPCFQANTCAPGGRSAWDERACTHATWCTRTRTRTHAQRHHAVTPRVHTQRTRPPGPVLGQRTRAAAHSNPGSSNSARPHANRSALLTCC